MYNTRMASDSGIKLIRNAHLFDPLKDVDFTGDVLIEGGLIK